MTKFNFIESLRYDLLVNFASLFRAVDQILTRVASGCNELPMVRDNITNVVYQGLEPDDGVDYDADDEMNSDDGDYIGDDGGNNNYGIQYVHFQP